MEPLSSKYEYGQHVRRRHRQILARNTHQDICLRVSRAPVTTVPLHDFPHLAVDVELIVPAPLEDAFIFEGIVDHAVTVATARQGEVDQGGSDAGSIRCQSEPGRFKGERAPCGCGAAGIGVDRWETGELLWSGLGAARRQGRSKENVAPMQVSMLYSKRRLLDSSVSDASATVDALQTRRLAPPERACRSPAPEHSPLPSKT